MNVGLTIKNKISIIFEMLGINDALINRPKNKNYIRVINYHDSHLEAIDNFRKQLDWYNEQFCNIDYEIFKKFMEGKYILSDKPGIMITFDDGKKSNYSVARHLLNEYGFTGYFFISPDLVGNENYMNWEEIIQLRSEGHIIGSHTCTHHRFVNSDTNDVVTYEIYESKKKIQGRIDIPVDIFCWCGGEEDHYTRDAARAIKEAGYKYSFMTNSFPVTSDTDRFHIQRSNIEDDWQLSLIKFQLSGIIDMKMKAKRKRVNELTTV